MDNANELRFTIFDKERFKFEDDYVAEGNFSLKQLFDSQNKNIEAEIDLKHKKEEAGKLLIRVFWK